MSDRQVPVPPVSDEPDFAYYWGWVAREKPDEDQYRHITTTPGIPDNSWMVEDVETATRQFVSGRCTHIRDMLYGWEFLERGMNREIAIRLFNEFVAGCRTVHDFENRNFSKKNQPKARQEFPSYLSGNPILSKASISKLHQKGYLPVTPVVYAHHAEEFFAPATNNMYYDLVFGDYKVFEEIMRQNVRNPNMPIPRVYPIPYNPNMQGPMHYQNVQPQQVHYRPMYQQYQMPVQYAQMPYQMMPQFVPMGAMPMQSMGPMGAMPMQQPQMQQIPPQMPPQMQHMQAVPQMHAMPQMYPMQQADVYAGPNYQQVFVPNGGNYDHANANNMRVPPPTFRGGHGNGNREPAARQNVEPPQRNGNGYENASTSSSFSSASTDNNAHSSVSNDSRLLTSSGEGTSYVAQEKEEKIPKKETSNDVNAGEGPSTSTIEEVTGSSETPETPVVDTEVAVELNSEDSTPTDTPSAVSVVDVSRRFSDVVSCGVSSKETAVVAHTEATSTALKSDVKVSELVVDTAESKTSDAPRSSQRTLAEIVQQKCSAAPSPAAVRNVTDSTQPSPAGSCSYAAVLSPASKKPTAAVAAVAAVVSSPQPKETKGTKEVSQRKDSRNGERRKGPSEKKRPSISYAQMLYATPKSTTSSSSSSTTSTTPKDPSGWQSVKTKKAAEHVPLPVTVTTPPRKISQPKPVPVAQSSSEEEEENVKDDDAEAEKKRQRRRDKRQKIKEANKQQKQTEKEMARQESLARVDAMNGDTPRQPTPPPAFDRNNLAARRRKRLELQRKNERSIDTGNDIPSPPKTSPPIVAPIIPAIKGNVLGASISAGQTAMAAYGLSGNQFRRSNSPFAIVAQDGEHKIPLFLPANRIEGEKRITLEEIAENAAANEGLKATVFPLQLTRQLPPDEPQPKATEVDENATMIERLLMFDSLEKIKELELADCDRAAIVKGLEDTKKMYVRVEKAGKLIAFKKGSSKTNQKMEEKLVSLTIKLLTSRINLNAADEHTVTEIAKKVTEASASFNYTNFLSALIDFAPARAEELPVGLPLRKNYEQVMPMTQSFLKKTKAVYDKIAKVYDFQTIDHN